MRIDHFSYQQASRVSILGLALQGAVGLTLLIFGRLADDTSLVVASTMVLCGLPVWGALAVVFYQHRLERLESLEREELAQSRGETIFERSAPDQEAAARRLGQMHRWLMPVVSLVVALALLGLGLWNWTRLRDMLDPGPGDNAFMVGSSLGWELAVCIGLALVAFIFARFVAGMSRQPAWQNLRGGAGFMVSSALVTLAIAVGIVFHVFQRPAVIKWMALGVAGFQVALAVEIFLNWTLNLYRPRRPNEIPRPAFDSRVLGLLAAPDNLVRGINEAVNYQFGFDITSSWGYKLLLRSSGALLAIGLATLIALSCIVVVGPGEQAVRLRGGMIAGRVHQGELMWKMPWPLETAEVVDIAQVHALPLQTVNLKVGKINLWGDVTDSSDNPRASYLVAAPALAAEVQKDLGASSEAGAVVQPLPPPGADAGDAAVRGISDRFALVDADLIVNWRIKPDGLLSWLNFAGDARVRRAGFEMRELVLREMSRRDVCQYLSTRPLDEVLSPSGAALATALRERIQQTFDREGTGVEVVSVQIPALRPPGEAAPMYEELSMDTQNARKVKEEAQRIVNTTMATLLGDARLAGQAVEAIDRWRSLQRDKGEDAPETREARLAVENILVSTRGQIATQIKRSRARRWELHLDARKTASQVLGQAGAFHVAPELFMQRKLMETLSQSLASVRQKYVLGIDPNRIRVDIQMQQPEVGLNLADYVEKKSDK
jgi:regulator of protease activity HflC (stomatin/prohibitin superfamily)